MNYRHAYHAGNFADVIKHITLVRILSYLHQKESAFRVIDSHAGAGLYDLQGDEASATGEWLTGIGRLMQTRWSEEAQPLVSPYLDIVRSFNEPGKLAVYPGSPLIARALLREQDSLVACEVEPKARKALVSALRRDPQARVVDIDGWVGLPAYVPPQERRGLVLIDPPFENKNEFDHVAAGFNKAFTKWSSGIFAIWYPAKSRRATEELSRRVMADVADLTGGKGSVLRLEFSVAPQVADGKLVSTGMLIVNPPWTLMAELKIILPELIKPLGIGGAARYRLETPKL